MASYLGRMKLSERLDDARIEEFQGLGAGPKTLEALRALRDASRHLKPPGAPTAVVRRTLEPPPPDEQRKLLEAVREYARNYTRSLPDFICVQVTRRYGDPTGTEAWRSMDTLTTRLTYFEQKESYKLVMVNNQLTDAPYESVGGASSTGEFGSMLNEVFAPDTQTRFHWERWATLRGRRAHVFAYRVARENSKWRISFERRLEIFTAYSGLVYVDAKTGMVLRLSLEAQDIPPDFPIRSASSVLDYDYTNIGDSQFLLPLRAVVRMREGRFLTKNEVEFRLYRKFAADAVITFETPDPLPEEVTEEQPPSQ